MALKRNISRGSPIRSVHGALTTDITESWDEDGVTVRYKSYNHITQGSQSEDRVYEEGNGEGLCYIIKKYNWLSDTHPGHLQKKVTMDWTPSSGRRVTRLEEWFTGAGWKICEYHYDAEKSLTDLIYYSARGQVLSHSRFDRGDGPFVRYDESGEIYEFGNFVSGKKDGTVHHKFNGKVFAQEWSDGKKTSLKELGSRVWPELLRNHGIQ